MREWIGAAVNTPSHAAYRKLMADGSTPPAALLPLNRAMHEGITVRDEQWIVERPNRKPLTVIVNVAPVRDADGIIVGAVHSWVDLTERQRLDRALRATESRLRVLVESNVIGLILSFDRSGKVAQAIAPFWRCSASTPRIWPPASSISARRRPRLRCTRRARICRTGRARLLRTL